MTEPAQQSSTTAGLPYPESTAALQQGANDIKALALALDGRVPVPRMVVKGLAGYTASSGTVAIDTGLTTCTSIMFTGYNSNPLLISVLSIAGGIVQARVFYNTTLTPYTGSFNMLYVAWGS